MLRQLLRGAGGPCLVLFLTVSGVAATPEDPVGIWKLKSACPDGKTRSCLVTVSKEGTGLKAHYSADGAESVARGVSFEQGILAFEVEGQYGGQSYGLAYKGSPADGKIRGTVTWSYGLFSGSYTFEGERVERAIAPEACETEPTISASVSACFSRCLQKARSWKDKLCDVRRRIVSVFHCSRFRFSLRDRIRTYRNYWCSRFRGGASAER